MNHYITIILSLAFCYSCSSNKILPSQSQTTYQSGKCYQEYQGKKLKGGVQEFVVYTGDETEEDVDILVLSILVEEGKQQWIKIKSDTCKSSNPNDREIYCLKVEPPVTQNHRILLNQDQTRNWIKKTIDIPHDSDAVSISYEVICSDLLTPVVISDLYQSLSEKGYKTGKPTDQMTRKLHKAVLQFQKDNAIKASGLDQPTAQLLGIAI